MKKKTALLSMLIVSVFIISSFGNVAMIAPTSGATTNFTLIVETNVGNRRRESYALYLKQTLAELNIEVTVLGKPFNQFVGDLLHLTGNDWDISIVGFTGGSPLAPDFVDLYACDGGFFGVLTYQLCEDTWNDALIASSTAHGNPINQSYIDNLLWDMTLDFNITSRKEKTDLFQQLFMEELLYDYPLLAATGLVGMWAGFDGYDPEEGLTYSSYKGGFWDYANYPTLTGRQNNATTYAFSIGSIENNFDPQESSGSNPRVNAIAEIFPSLVMFDKGYNPHPNIATSYNVDSWTNVNVTTWKWYDPTDNLFNATYGAANNLTDGEDYYNTSKLYNVEFGHQHFTLRNDAAWVNTTGGPHIAKDTNGVDQYIKPSDFKFMYDMYMSDVFVINGQSSYQYVERVDANDTAGTLDIYISQPQLDDLFLGSYNPVPKFLLGGDLHLDNGSKFRALETPDNTYLDNEVLFNNNSINGWDSVEWNAYELNPIQAGPYYVDFTNNAMYSDGAYVKKAANPFFWFPNEALDSPGGDFDLRDAVTTHNYDGRDSYFFGYDGNNTRPTELKIKSQILPIVEDITADLLLFKTGAIDNNAPDFFGGAEVQAQKNDPRFAVYTFQTSSTADLLMFNMIDKDLKNYDVRRAIASAVDKDALQAIVDNTRLPQDSPVKLYFKASGWYKDDWKIPYDLDTAKQLLLQNGYTISEATGTTSNVVQNPGDIIGNIQAAGSEMFIFLSAFATVFSAVVVKRKRRN